MRQTRVRLRLLLRPFWASLKPENFHRKKTYRRPCRQNGGSDRDSHRDHSNPEPIGAVGTLSGLVLGYSFSFISGSYHLIPLDPQVYAVPYVPFHPSLFDGLWITVVAMGISIGATILPARAAVRLLPVEILRFE